MSDILVRECSFKTGESIPLIRDAEWPKVADAVIEAVNFMQKLYVCAVKRERRMVLCVHEALSFRRSPTRNVPQGKGVWSRLSIS